MSPALAWLIAELTKLAVERISSAGKLNSLTQEEAEVELAKISGQLSTSLPSPKELIGE